MPPYKNSAEFSAIQSTSANTSDLILLSSKILHDQLGQKFDDNLQKIGSHYLNEQYTEALDMISSSARDLPNPQLSEVLASKIEIAASNDSPYKDTSRRYFDTDFAQKVWENQAEGHFQSANKLAEMIRKSVPTESELGRELKDVPVVKSKEDVAVAIGCIREFGEFPQFSDITHELRDAATSLSQAKDRGAKRIFAKGDEPLSQNPGLMKANDPMPADRLLNKVAKGKITDQFTIDTTKVDGYSATHTQVPYVNSVSGTTYALVAILSQYMSEHKSDPDLNKDVNNIVQSFLSFTCKGGYHSISEMTDVLLSKESQEVFNKYNVKLAPLPDSITTQAFLQAAKYSEKINLQSNVNASIKEALSSEIKAKAEAEARQAIGVLAKSFRTSVLSTQGNQLVSSMSVKRSNYRGA